MRIFLSWSGEQSKYLANCFKEWLPLVLQYCDPYMSEKDIKLGERWSQNIQNNLSENDFGLVFVTDQNITAPWINFESGALSKTLQSRLIPILYEVQISNLSNSPLSQFQSAKSLDKEMIKDIISEINSGATEFEQLTEDRLNRSFNKWWDELEEKLKKVPHKNNKVVKEIDEKEMLNSLYQEFYLLKKEIINTRPTIECLSAKEIIMLKEHLVRILEKNKVIARQLNMMTHRYPIEDNENKRLDYVDLRQILKQQYVSITNAIDIIEEM